MLNAVILYFKKIDEQWRYVFTVFSLSYILTWTFFAILWYLIAYLHGDLLSFDASEIRLNNGWKPCVTDATSFIKILQHSIEIQVRHFQSQF